ncbi:hypothetical protein R0135_01085 [Congregibacter variabilis]|uniref:Uncharacterized protein n=1 Tax=Congregibacter variabilis TaxID=3081200 RepID=A0ABZ0I3N3_9GAMM|nr:hypothetical protein R0135_01085 [Congregibacter sp. IMCC43200]
MMIQTVKRCVGILSLIIASSASAAPPAEAPAAITIEFDGRETTAHSLTMGVENNINIGSISAGGGGGQATFKELVITKSPNDISEELFSRATTGDSYNIVRITTSSMFIDLKLVVIQEVNFQANECDPKDKNPCIPELEEVVIQFGEASYTLR